MLTTYQISQLLEGELKGDPDIIITGPSKIEEGGIGTITFLANPKYDLDLTNYSVWRIYDQLLCKLNNKSSISS